MGSAFERIDLWILDNIFQKIADYWTDRTGTSCFQLTTIVVMLFISSIFFQGAVAILSKPGIQWSVFLFFPLLSYLFWRILIDLRDREKILLEKKAMNPERKFYYSGMIRLMALSFLPSDIGSSVRAMRASPVEWTDAISVLSSFLIVCMFYFFACTPKPPAPLKKEARELVTDSV